MNDKYRDLEKNKLKELESDFSRKGYSVLVNPRRTDLPEFLRKIDSSPDLIATSPDDNIVVEIKSRKSIKADFKLAMLAEAVNANKNWKFMLVYTNPKTQIESRPDITSDIKSIIRHLDYFRTSHANFQNPQVKQAHFLLLWATFEAAASAALDGEGYSVERRATLSLIRDSTIAGLISHSDNETLERMYQKRNKLLHGILTTDVTQGDISKLLSICEELINSNI